MTRTKQPGRDRVDLKVDPDDRVRWEEAANAEDLTLSQWLRRLANAEVKRQERRERGRV